MAWYFRNTGPAPIYRRSIVRSAHAVNERHGHCRQRVIRQNTQQKTRATRSYTVETSVHRYFVLVSLTVACEVVPQTAQAGPDGCRLADGQQQFSSGQRLEEDIAIGEPFNRAISNASRAGASSSGCGRWCGCVGRGWAGAAGGANRGTSEYESGVGWLHGELPADRCQQCTLPPRPRTAGSSGTVAAPTPS